MFTSSTRWLPRWQSGQESICQCRRCRFDPWVGRILEKQMPTHSRILALKTPWTEEPGGQQSELKWSKSVVSDSLWPQGLYSSQNSPGQNTAVGDLSLLQGIFPTQELNPGLLQCKQILCQRSHKGSPRTLEWVAYAFSRDSASYVAGGFFTHWVIRATVHGVTKSQTRYNRHLNLSVPLSIFLLLPMFWAEKYCNCDL